MLEAILNTGIALVVVWGIGFVRALGGNYRQLRLMPAQKSEMLGGSFALVIFIIEVACRSAAWPVALWNWAHSRKEAP